MSLKEFLYTTFEIIVIGFYRGVIFSLTLSLCLTVGFWWAYKYECLAARLINRKFTVQGYLLGYCYQLFYCFSLD